MFHVSQEIYNSVRQCMAYPEPILVMTDGKRIFAGEPLAYPHIYPHMNSFFPEYNILPLDSGKEQRELGLGLFDDDRQVRIEVSISDVNVERRWTTCPNNYVGQHYRQAPYLPLRLRYQLLIR